MANDGLDPYIDQGGSSYSGNFTVHGGPFHQGNIINIQQTADRCLIDLRVTDPRHDKKRVQNTQGGLLADLYVWVLGNPDFRQWRDYEDQRLLCIKGDLGKGKTMLLCGIIDKLEKLPAEGRRLSYFFCQATIEHINTATAVLRGLIFMLLDQDASLVSHIKKKYDVANKGLFQGDNTWYALSEIFTNMLCDPKLHGICLVVDALDKCIGGLLQLLKLIVETSQATCAKWLVSSRNWPQIKKELSNVAHMLSLEVNAKSVAAAIDSYILHKVSQLVQRKSYRDNTTDEVRQSIEAVSQTLKRDIYGLHDRGFPIKDVPRRRPDPDPLAAIGYSCVHWVNHLIDASKAPGRDDSVQEYGTADRFLRKKGLYWIESLSLLRSMSEGMLALERLIRHLQSNVELNARSIWARGTLIGRVQNRVAEQWSACEAILEGHTSSVNSAAFLADGRRVVLASYNQTVRLWDAASGACLSSYEVGYTSTVSFDPTGTLIYTYAGDICIKESISLDINTHP
ncbi:Uu.00g118240.m01.CDS01 [Anthostomella pinea]|uniref:Uu.00g118240.m01.CDS01 n=1 Tax=Anthostomella pinea TaxID=933095 RepID=A0AAI8VGE6_9PEZI|nr:Uu.00g118240.m01.CDS01 [Anthostomella pinea]